MFFTINYYDISSSFPFWTNFFSSILYSQLHFVLYKNLPAFSNSYALMLLINFLYAIFSFICSKFLLKNLLCQFFISLQFKSKCDSFCSFRHNAQFLFLLRFLRSLFPHSQSKPCYCISLIYLTTCCVCNSFLHSFFIAQQAFKNLFSLFQSVYIVTYI